MTDPDKLLARVQECAQDWAQGHCVLGEELVYRFCPAAPLTDESRALAEDGFGVIARPVAGLVVVSQTCDVVRDPSARPYVEMAALVKVNGDELQDVRRGRRPRYAWVPGVEDRFLVADLDLVVTVEKGCLLEWQPIAGCRNEQERRRFAWSLSRKRGRPAFPDDFVDAVRPLRDRLQKKAGKDSLEGRLIDALREIRVMASPSWSADSVSLEFFFLLEDRFPGAGDDVGDVLEDWLGRIRVEPGGRFQEPGGIVCTLDDISARDYVDSDPLDLDHLSLS